MVHKKPGEILLGSFAISPRTGAKTGGGGGDFRDSRRGTPGRLGDRQGKERALKTGKILEAERKVARDAALGADLDGLSIGSDTKAVLA
jgi:hypothetical protein